jgi:hypothetical protein
MEGPIAFSFSFTIIKRRKGIEGIPIFEWDAREDGKGIVFFSKGGSLFFPCFD